MEPNYHDQSPQQKGPTTRYYDYIRSHSELTLGHVVMAVDAMLEALPFEPSVTVDELFQKELIPSEEELAQDARLAKERLLLLPLVTLRDDVDASVDDARELYDWYSTVTKYITALTKNDHDKSCHTYNDGIDGLPYHCRQSDVCPLRYTSYVLRELALQPDVTSKEYQRDSKRADRVVYARIGAGMEHEIIQEVEGQQLFISYCDKAEAARRERIVHGAKVLGGAIASLYRANLFTK